MSECAVNMLTCVAGKGVSLKGLRIYHTLDNLPSCCVNSDESVEDTDIIPGVNDQSHLSVHTMHQQSDPLLGGS